MMFFNIRLNYLQNTGLLKTKYQCFDFKSLVFWRVRIGKAFYYNQPVIVSAGIARWEKANIFLPKSFSDAPR